VLADESHRDERETKRNENVRVALASISAPRNRLLLDLWRLVAQFFIEKLVTRAI
jgi:hypothetical protein